MVFDTVQRSVYVVPGIKFDTVDWCAFAGANVGPAGVTVHNPVAVGAGAAAPPALIAVDVPQIGPTALTVGWTGSGSMVKIIASTTGLQVGCVTV